MRVGPETQPGAEREDEEQASGRAKRGGPFARPLLGAALFLSLEELVWRNYLQVHTGVLGLMIVLLVLFLPKGVLALKAKGRG